MQLPAPLMPCELRVLETLRAQIEAAERKTRTQAGITVVSVSGGRSGSKTRRRVDFVAQAYDRRDLDMMRVYSRYVGVQSREVLQRLVLSMRAVHGRVVAPLITDLHVSAYADVLEALTDLNFEQNRQSDDVDERVMHLAFEDLRNTALIVHLIRDRRIVDIEELRTQILDLRTESPSPTLVEGAL